MVIADFIKKNNLPDDFKQLIEVRFLPLIQRIITQSKENKSPYFIGINGCQGSGKSTLSAFISQYLTCTYSLKVVVMSLDDFYLCQYERKKIADNIHPMFNTRGVPGTHDTQKLTSVLRQLTEQSSNITIPTFNKATDEPNDKNTWQYINEPMDIVIIEGWCWGVAPQEDNQLIEPINTLERDNDSQGIWRSYVNQQLTSYYQPLYTTINYWVVLQAPSFDCVYRWRLEQEQKLAQSLPMAEQLKVMNAAKVLNFTQYFQRLTEHGIKTLVNIADTTLFLDENRKINRVTESNK